MKRVKWIDICKGIGIILVVLGHAPREVMRNEFWIIDIVYRFIYSFHMGLFFFLSGLTFGMIDTNKSKTNIIIKKVKVLLIPWLTYSIFIYVFILAINHFQYVHNILIDTNLKVITFLNYFKLSFLAQNPYAFHLWFLLVLFIIQIIFLIYDKVFTDNENVMLYFMIIFCIIMLFINSNIIIIKYIFEYLFYYILGYIYIKNEKFEIILNKYKYFGVLGTIFYSILKSLQYDYLFIDIINMIFITPLMISFVIYISKKLEFSKINKKLSMIGRDSFIIYLFHQPFCCAILGMIMLKLLPSSFISYLIIISTCIIASFIFPYLICYVIKKLANRVIRFLVIRLNEQLFSRDKRCVD